MSQPRVSVLMVTCGRAQFIGESLKSVQAQSFSNWELIVLDDGSEDGTEEIVKRFAQNDPRIRYVRRNRRTSIAMASNVALARARGEYVAILDDDDTWVDGRKLAKQVDFLGTHLEYVGCGGGAIAVDESGAEKMRFRKPSDDDGIKRRALLANPMINSTTMFRRDAAERAGRYDETLKQFADWDFWLNVGREGKLYNFPDYFVRYRMWREGASFAKQKESARAALRIVFRYRRQYQGFLRGLCLASLYGLHAYLPEWIKRVSTPPLARLKKILFGA